MGTIAKLVSNHFVHVSYVAAALCKRRFHNERQRLSSCKASCLERGCVLMSAQGRGTGCSVVLEQQHRDRALENIPLYWSIPIHRVLQNKVFTGTEGMNSTHLECALGQGLGSTGAKGLGSAHSQVTFSFTKVSWVSDTAALRCCRAVHSVQHRGTHSDAKAAVPMYAAALG